MDSVMPRCNFRRHIPASIRAAALNGGVFISPCRITSGFDVTSIVFMARNYTKFVMSIQWSRTEGLARIGNTQGTAHEPLRRRSRQPHHSNATNEGSPSRHTAAISQAAVILSGKTPTEEAFPFRTMGISHCRKARCCQFSDWRDCRRQDNQKTQSPLLIAS